uniref:Uncharacterized protein n=1 Tax=Sinocyclocheilus anshuiensis TaxID=1608454 RepID=A0A671KIN7_9TELE
MFSNCLFQKSQAMKRCSAHTYAAAAAAAAAVRRALSSGAATPSVFTRFLFKLSHYFYDVENILVWNDWLRTQAVIRKNRLFGYAQNNFGNNIAAAYYILTLRGSVRFAGQSEWLRPDSRGRFSYDFMSTPDTQIEEVDLSGTLINHNGLETLGNQRLFYINVHLLHELSYFSRCLKPLTSQSSMKSLFVQAKFYSCPHLVCHNSFCEFQIK